MSEYDLDYWAELGAKDAAEGKPPIFQEATDDAEEAYIEAYELGNVLDEAERAWNLQAA